MPAQTENKKAVKREAAEGKKDLYYAFAICIGIVAFVRSFVYEPYSIPSSSMFPTLMIGDRIFVSKFNYGLSLPFTKVHVLKWQEPKRGDVIVFLFPRDESLSFVKRVIAVPGDTVEVKGKDVIVNGKAYSKELISEPAERAKVMGSSEKPQELYRETIDEKTHYALFRESGVSEFERSTSSEVVPPDSYFVMGDNRDDSSDSRRWGFVPRDNIKGKAQVVWLSLDRDAASGFGGVRWERFFSLIR